MDELTSKELIRITHAVAELINVLAPIIGFDEAKRLMNVLFIGDEKESK